MEDEQLNIQYEEDIYLYKIVYLVRTNLPSSEYIYIIMFFIKYIGLILFSISLNEWKKDQKERNPDFMDNKDNDPSNTSIKSFLTFLSNLLLNGNSLKILKNYYQIICFLGFCFLFIYIIFIIYGFYYMKKKYFKKKYLSLTDKKLLKINNSSKFEKKFFKILTYIFFVIIFFHQYIIEYYIFGFLGNLLNFFGVFDNESFNNNVLREYNMYINDYILNMNFNEIVTFVINLLTITIIFIFFILFMLLNSTKTLFINNCFPFYGNNKYLSIKIILFNLNQWYGFLNMVTFHLKQTITIIVIIILMIILLTDIILSFYNFSFYPCKVAYMCIFIEFFCFFGIVTELIIYVTSSNVDSLKFKILKLMIVIFNSLIFTIYYIYKKNDYNLNIFSNNLFSKTFKTFNPNDIYFYIETYIKYNKNKKDNYIKIFRLIQSHTLTCIKKDCHCKTLIPEFMSYSLFTNFSKYKNDNSQNDYENINSNNVNTKEEKTDETHIHSKRFSESNIQNKELNFLELNNKNVKMSPKNNVLINESETRKPNLKYKKTDNNKNNNEEKNNAQNPIQNNKKKSFVQDNNNLIDSYIKTNNKTDIITDKDLLINNSEKRKLKDEQFKMIGEQEIINRINFLYKRKNYHILETYIFIHLQYLIKIKQNYRLALYFAGKYFVCGIRFSFLTRYFLYEITKYISNSIINLQNIKLIHDPYIIKYRQENVFMKKFLNYVFLFNMIKKLLKTACQKIIYFYSFRSDLHNSLSLQKYIKTKIYPVINSSQEIQNSISKLNYLIEKYNKEEKHSIESIELSYLISNFFKLIDGKISQDILKNITPILYFKEMHYKKLENEFHLFMMNNPLIISLTKKDTFNICYFTNIFLDKLGYKFIDLKNQDFHEKLFPGGQEIIKEHTYIMKQFLFFNKNVFAKDKTFIKSKEGYLVSINFSAKTFPNFSKDFFLIINIIFNDEVLLLDNSYPIDGIKKTNNNNINSGKVVHSYSFLLNHDFDFYGLTKNFYLEYELNQNMFRELRINFCQFFCIDEIKLIEEIHNEKKNLSKKYPNFNNKISLKELNKAYSIFRNIEIENTFKLREEKLLESFFFQPIIIYDKIDKRKLINKIPEIISIIDEIGLDYDWYIRLKNFKEKLIINSHFQNFKESLISQEHEKINECIKENCRHSSIISPDNYETDFIKYPEQYFEVIYSIKKLGSISYYIVNLYEKISNNKPKPSKEVNEILSKIDSYEENLIKKEKSRKNKKDSLTKTLRLHRFLSVSSRTIEGINEDGENKPIKRNAKTRIYLPERISNKKSIILASINEDKNIKDLPIIEEKTKQSETNNIENKKEENEKDNNYNNNNNINETKDKKPQKTIKILDKTEYNKKMKDNRKDNPEDEENSPLISKDKFNEILEKNNKRNKILIIIIFIIIFISTILILSKFSISLKGFSISKNLLKTTIYLEMLKIDIYVQGILSIIYCINENENITDITNIQSEAKLKIKSTMDHLKSLQDQITIIVNNKYCSGILNILGQKCEIFSLNDDWSYTKQYVELLEEIRSLSIKLTSLSNSTDICNLTSTFYLSEKLNPENYLNGKLEKSNDIQKIIYYFFRNIFTSYKPTFDKLLEEGASSIELIWENFQHILFYLLTFVIIITLIFFIFYVIKFCFDYSYYQLLFLYYYDIESEHLKFENQINYLYKTILEFNCDNIDYFEYVKSNENLIFYDNDDINSIYSNITKNNSNNNSNIVKNNLNLSITMNQKNDKRGSSSFKSNKDNNKNNIVDKSNMSGSLLNSSINGSSFQFLNNSNKNLLNNNIDIPNLNEKDDKKNSKEESIDSLLNISNKILPNSLNLSLFFIILGIISYFSLCTANFIGLYRENKIWKYSINLSMNILERVPRLMGILIYACVAIITGNENLIAGSPFDDNQSNYLTYFKANSLYYSEDIMNKYFKNNSFGELLRDNLRINYNFNNYLFQESNDIFTSTKYWETLLDIGGEFCINAAIGEVLSFQEEYTVYDFASEINYYATTCKQDNTGINESGASLEITYILEEITNKFIEFIVSNKLDLNEARKNFFSSSDIRRIVVDMQLSLVLYYNTISYAVNLDFEKKNNKIINEQILYSLILLAIHIIIIIILVLSIMKNEKYKKLFGYFSEIPKNNYNI